MGHKGSSRFFLNRRAYALIVAFFVAIVVGVFIYQALQTPALERKIRIAMEEVFRDQQIPYKISKLRLKIDAKEFIKGHIEKIEFEVEHLQSKKRVHIVTPADYDLHASELSLKLSPEITIEGLPKIVGAIDLTIPYLRNATKLKVQALHIDFELETASQLLFSHEGFKAEIAKISSSGYVDIDLAKTPSRIELDHSTDATDVRLNVQGKEWAEKKISFSQEASLLLASTIEIASSHTEVKHPFPAGFDLSMKDQILKGGFETKIPAQTILQKFAAFSDLKTFNALSADGVIGIQGKISGPQNDPSIHSRIKYHAKRIAIPQAMGKYSVTLKNLALDTPLNYPLEEFEGSLKIDEIDAELFKTKKFSALISGIGTELILELGQKNGEIEPIVTPAFGSQIKIPKLKIRFPLIPNETGESDFRFPGIDVALLISISVSGGPFQITELQKAFCLFHDKPLDGTLTLDYPRIFNSQSGLHILGETRIETLGGRMQVDALRYFWKNGTPKVRLSAYWSDLDLQKIGALIKFGDMRGSLHGSLVNAEYSLTEIGPVPMDYDFTVKGSARSGKAISFYGRAVDNLLELLGSRKQEMPWYAKLGINTSIAFRNWFPATADYMGFRAKTSGGWTEISTFDPPEEKNHYLLSGTGFKIPLNTHGVYPAIMRTDAFQGWLWGMVDYFKKLSADRQEKSGEKENDSQCTPFWKTSD